MHFKKRIAALAALAALAAVPAQASAATSAGDTQAITADVAATLEVTSWASDFSFGTSLAPGTQVESGDQTFTVKSNAGWGVNAYDADLDSAGKLTKYSTGAFVPATKMLNALQFKLVSVGGTATGTSYANLPTSAGTAEYTTEDVTGDSGKAVVSKLAQTPSYSDSNLGTDDYRIVVTYNVDQAL